jgi:hypothetical protein
MNGLRSVGLTIMANTCYDPSKPHLVYHVYQSKRRCESNENVSCTDLDGQWIPIGKPVVYDESENK